jgi:hypothetical protein
MDKQPAENISFLALSPHHAITSQVGCEKIIQGLPQIFFCQEGPMATIDRIIWPHNEGWERFEDAQY